jgi:hypothetical protein
MVDPVDVLKAKKAKILADAQREADAVDDDVREFERLRSLAEKYDLVLVEKSEARPRVRLVELKNGQLRDKPLEVNEAAYKAAISVAEHALKQAKGPLELTVLFDACVSAGVPIGGQRPVNTLSAYLSHPKSTVESIRKGVYWLKGVDLPH